jgi:hypothetical protein
MKLGMQTREQVPWNVIWKIDAWFFSREPAHLLGCRLAATPGRTAYSPGK